jgi:iron complex transport system substrate-binding protein
MRLVSLSPSATEIIYALGLDDQLVGVTFECNEPPSARRDKTVVVAGRDTSELTPAEIDAYVRVQVAAGLDLYTLHADALAALDPDMIITQDLCRVCALPAGQVEDALDYLGCRADVVSIDPQTLAEVLDSIITIGARAGAGERAHGLVVGLHRRLDAVARAVADRPRPRVVVIEWIDPPFSAGHWVPDLVRAAGGEPIAARPGLRSVETTWDELIVAAPDVVLVAPCGFDLDGASRQAESVASRFDRAQIWAIDADGLVVRPGPRLVDGVEAIASVLHHGVVPESRAVRRVG